MEAMGGACILDGEWESLYKTFSSDPDVDFEDLFIPNPPFPSDHPPQDETLIGLLTGDPNPAPFLSDLGAPFCTPISNRLSHSGSSSSAGDLGAGYVNTLNQLTQLLDHGDQVLSSLSPFDFLLSNGLLEGQLIPSIEGPKSNQIDRIDDDLNRSSLKRKLSYEIEMEDEEAPVQPKKRSRPSKNANKGKRKVQTSKNQDELGGEEGTITNGGSSCEISDDESNVSEETINRKKRASRGAATDPQSLYARKRRERINERLRILQTLVPNGTKVDISTMLEEAVHYVKFLQLQIKLLSSDEMWMYAPLAFNGFDVDRLYNTFSPYQLHPQ